MRHLQSKYRAAVRITFGLTVTSRLSRTLVIPAETIFVPKVLTYRVEELIAGVAGKRRGGKAVN
jgi:hypothetical protein